MDPSLPPIVGLELLSRCFKSHGDNTYEVCFFSLFHLVRYLPCPPAFIPKFSTLHWMLIKTAESLDVKMATGVFDRRIHMYVETLVFLPQLHNNRSK